MVLNNYFKSNKIKLIKLHDQDIKFLFFINNYINFKLLFQRIIDEINQT